MEAPDDSALADLVASVAATGDRQAFALLFRHFAPKLKAYLMRQGADAAVAEEVMQEAMLMVWRRAATFDRRQAGVATWLFTIARNKRIDALRRTRRLELDPEDPALVPTPPDMADAAYAARQNQRRLRAAIAELPVEQSELLTRSYFEEKSHSEIAEELGLPLGTVKSRLRLALSKLRGALKE